MDGIGKVIDELGLMILMKEIEIESQQKEIERLKRKIKTIEQYLEMYEDNCNYEFALKK